MKSGKGDKDRTTYLDEGAAAALRDWLELRGDHPGTLFHPTFKGGRISSRRLSDQAVSNVKGIAVTRQPVVVLGDT